jgi:hypothetical protein
MKALKAIAIVKKKRPYLDILELYSLKDLKSLKVEKDELVIEVLISPQKPKNAPRTDKTSK